MTDGDLTTEVKGISLITEQAREVLNQRQLIDYRDHREKLIRWMLNLGKDPSSAEGYAYHTARRRADDCDKFYRWKWSEGGYTTEVTHDDADAYMRELVYGDRSASYKTNIQKTLKMLFRWRSWEYDEDRWEPELSISDSRGATQPRDFLSREERQQIREVALEYGSVPHYNSLSPTDRDKWKRYLARRFRKPMSEIAKSDFERANGFKIPSLVWTSLDAGLRPIEVKRAQVQWVDTDNAVLRVPADQAAKNNEHWTVSLQQRTFIPICILQDDYTRSYIYWGDSPYNTSIPYYHPPIVYKLLSPMYSSHNYPSLALVPSSPPMY